MDRWAFIREQLTIIIGESDEPIDPATVQNAFELLVLAETQCPPPLEIARGYWPTIRIIWSDSEFEVFESSIEFYSFYGGAFDVREHLRSPGEPFPENLLADLGKTGMSGPIARRALTGPPTE